MRRRNHSIVRSAITAVLAVLAVSCSSRTEPPATAASDRLGIAPALVVEQFLHAVATRDYDTMARLFGTREGSVLRRDPRSEVEKRMFALASILRHEDYALDGELLAPGRVGEAVRIVVRMRIGGREVPVPFTVVRTPSSGWLVENIDVEAITASG